ncbi:MAG: hypothetical protein IV097_12430 [Burkholderiaceae bacterium]|nr:hypothetical protein [Burkholderiaceae bacterium]
MPLEKPAVAPQKSRILVAITATALLAGILLTYAPRGRSFALLAEAPALLAWALLYCWYKADLVQKRRLTSTTFNGLVIALSWLILPGYFFHSRGAWGGAKATLLFYLGLLAWGLVAGLASVAWHAAGSA